MAEVIQRENVKLVVTSRGFGPARRFKFALRRAIPGARVRSSGFREDWALKAEGDPFELAKHVYDECPQSIGHVTAVHEEPWAFVVVQDRAVLECLSDRAKRFSQGRPSTPIQIKRAICSKYLPSRASTIFMTPARSLSFAPGPRVHSLRLTAGSPRRISCSLPLVWDLAPA